MKNLFLTIAVLLGATVTAQADVWMWLDAAGNQHFVDTKTPIFTWVDGDGEAHFSDTPDHETATAVEFVWYSEGSLDAAGSQEAGSASEDPLRPGETEEERAERKRAEAYYCQQATELYESYVDAPHVFRTTDSGKREYLSKKEKSEVIAQTLAQKEEYCQ